MSDTAERRPASVSVALVLLGVGYAVYVAFVLVGNMAEPPAFEGGTPAWFLPFLVAVAVVVCGLAFGLLAAAYCRRRWAYMALLVLTTLWLVRTAQTAVIDHGAGSSALVYLAMFVIPAAALVLLLRRPVRGWYRAVESHSRSDGRWLADPDGCHQFRYWDGRAWTDHVADDGVTALDPPTDLTPGVRQQAHRVERQEVD